MKKVELLAPAGNYESFLGAIHAGADAVYLGGDKFGARAYADNFNTERLCEAIRYAHLFGRKVYLTLNTLIKETEMQELCEYLRPFCNAGLDGVIIQDIGVLCYVRKQFPKLSIHISTQMTVTGIYGANLLKAEGAERVVPARELSLEEIHCLKEQTGLEIETFIHGAMCYCYSGQCLFSSILGGRSGNRGKCAQPCRLPYRICTGKTTGASQYPLSLKDMCTIDHIPELIQAGIDSFKIEGRMKRPEYAAGVTAIYRKYIDSYYRNPSSGISVSQGDREALASLYIRSEIQDGYYYKHNGSDMVTLDNPSYNGSSDILLEEIRKNYITASPKLPVKLHAVFQEKQEAELILEYEDIRITEKGSMVQKAAKQPITAENIKNGLEKLGNTVFSVQEITLELGKGIFYPLKAINELRRSAVARLEDRILARNGSGKIDCMEYSATPPALPDSKNLTSAPAVHILLHSKEQVSALLEAAINIRRIYLDSEICGKPDDFYRLIRSIRGRLPDTELFMALPYIVRQKDISALQTLLPVLELMDGCLFRNMETYGWLKEEGYSGRLCSDAGVYIWNRESFLFWRERKLNTFCLPYELNKREKAFLLKEEGSFEQVIYGRLPMMITANCIAKTAKQCRQTGTKHTYSLLDRYNKRFPVYTNCRYCYNIIYNSVPLSLHDKMTDLPSNMARRLDFTNEDASQTLSVLRFFQAALEGQKHLLPYEEYTTGHEKRGAE